jgi:septum site-determining protein MinD
MRTITFAVSKGGIGKSLLTANVGAALSAKGKKVILLEGDPNRPLQLLLGINQESIKMKLDDIVKKDLPVEKAVYKTSFENLFLIPSGLALDGYFALNPMRFSKKIMDLDADFVFIDVPFPLGEAAYLSLGVCQYFVLILTEDEFTLSVEAAIDTIRLGKYYLKCVPIGFVLNRIKNPDRFTSKLIDDLVDLLEIKCIGKIEEDAATSKSYGGAKEAKAFLSYNRDSKSSFHKSIDSIADVLLAELPKPEKKDIPLFLQSIIKPSKT